MARTLCPHLSVFPFEELANVVETLNFWLQSYSESTDDPEQRFFRLSDSEYDMPLWTPSWTAASPPGASLMAGSFSPSPQAVAPFVSPFTHDAEGTAKYTHVLIISWPPFWS